MFGIDTLSFIAGLLLLFVALIGGGFKIQQIEMPKVSGIIRILSALAGIVLLVIGLSLYYSKNDEKTIVDKVEAKSETMRGEKVYCPDCRVWNFLWVGNGTQYEALLVFNPLKGFGRMRVRYFNGTATVVIQEEMNQKSTDQGQYLEGRNPFDVVTSQPIAAYVPDNLIMNNESVQVFDNSGIYETTILHINDVNAAYKVFGFNYSDLDF